jgi:hypothetical protein
LALEYDKATGALNRSVEAIKTAAKAEADRLRSVVYAETYTAALVDEVNARAELAKRTEEYNRILAEYNRLVAEGESLEDLVGLKTQKEDAMRMVNETRAVLRESQIYQMEAENFWAEQAAAAVDYETAVRDAVYSVADDLQKLADDYDKTYETARKSIESTIGLFNVMKTESSVSASEMITAMQSQIEFIDTYKFNLQEASRYGITDGLIASLSDGSKESAGHIDAIVREYGRLYNLDPSKAAEFIATFNEQFSGVEAAKDSFASTVRDMTVDFGGAMDEMKDHLSDLIDDMNMSEEAAQAAHATAAAYIDTLRAALQSGSISAGDIADFTSGFIFKGFAKGTTNAPNVFVAGERGPELIVGAAGSTVFPAGETAKIINAVERVPFHVPAPENLEYARHSINESISSMEKRIVLDINGSGAIDVTGADAESVWEIVAPRLKPAFMDIIQEEIFEEGDRAYAF